MVRKKEEIQLLEKIDGVEKTMEQRKQKQYWLGKKIKKALLD